MQHDDEDYETCENIYPWQLYIGYSLVATYMHTVIWPAHN